MHILGGSKGGSSKGAGEAAKDGIAYVTERDFEQVVLQSEIPVLVQFTADWCQPCKTVAPEVLAFSKEMAGKVTVVKVDIDKSQMLARQLRIRSVPTFMLFAEQRVADAQAGALNQKQLRAMVEPFLPRAEGALKALELAHLVKEGVATPIDVRDASAFGRAHIPSAKNLPLEEIESRLGELFMMPGQPVLYDRSGDKVKELADRLGETGSPIAFLEGGFLAWESDGLPVERP